MKEPERKRGEPLQPLAQHQARSISRARSIAAPSPIRFTRAICGDLVQAERREWWIANGLGGYAGGTIAGSLTRRYHGLLIAPIASPLGRRLILAKADATVIEGSCEPMEERRDLARGLHPHRQLSPRLLGSGLDLRARRASDRGAHLDGAGGPYDLCRLAAAATGGAAGA
jgi:hypothetical protein